MSTSLLDLAIGLGSKSAVYFFAGIYYFLPNLAHYSFRTEAANGIVPNWPMLFGGIAYAAVYIAILLTGTITHLQPTEFQITREKAASNCIPGFCRGFREYFSFEQLCFGQRITLPESYADSTSICKGSVLTVSH